MFHLEPVSNMGWVLAPTLFRGRGLLFIQSLYLSVCLPGAAFHRVQLVLSGICRRECAGKQIVIIIMKHWIACSLLVSVLFLTGCESVNHSQLQVMAPAAARGAAVTVPASEREMVKLVITEIAQRWRLEDRTAISLTPDTICSFAQPDVKHPISIKAWVAADRISVDIFQPPAEPGESSSYQRFRNQVMDALRIQFGDRLKQAQKLNQVSSKSTVKEVAP